LRLPTGDEDTDPVLFVVLLEFVFALFNLYGYTSSCDVTVLNRFGIKLLAAIAYGATNRDIDNKINRPFLMSFYFNCF